MTIVLAANDIKKLDIALTPIAAPLDIDLSVAIKAPVLPICPGATIYIEATIHNKTNYAQSYASTYYVNGVVTCESTHNSIAPNATYRGICTYTVPAIGTYNVRVVVDGFEATTSFEAVAVPVGVPDMVIPINIVTSDIKEGQNSYCAIFVTNRGTGAGDIFCAWYLDNKYIETDAAHLVPGANAHFVLATPVLTSGTHIVMAAFTWDGHSETRTGSFTVALPFEAYFEYARQTEYGMGAEAHVVITWTGPAEARVFPVAKWIIADAYFDEILIDTEEWRFVYYAGLTLPYGFACYALALGNHTAKVVLHWGSLSYTISKEFTIGPAITTSVTAFSATISASGFLLATITLEGNAGNFPMKWFIDGTLSKSETLAFSGGFASFHFGFSGLSTGTHTVSYEITIDSQIFEGSTTATK